MSDFLRLITLQDANTRVVLLGAALLGLASGVVGLFAVLRKRALAGDAVAHAALPGVCAAYFIVGERSFPALLLGALVFGLLAAAFIAMVRSLTRVKEDAATAIAIGSFFGLGIAMSRIIQNQPQGNRAGLDHFLFGKAASMVVADARLIAIVAAAVLVIVLLLFKEFKLLCFDRDFALSLWGGGSARSAWKVRGLDLLLMGLIAVCTVVGLPAVGVVLMVGLLVIPAAAARFWTDRLGVMTIVSGGIGLLSGVIGVAASAALPTPSDMLSRGWPTGPMITLVAVLIFAASLLLAPRRGVVADLLRHARNRHRISTQNVLRAIYEEIERRGELSRATTVLVSDRIGGSPVGWRRAAAAGLIAQAPTSPSAPDRTFHLTRYGLAEAAKVVRAHRVWELFLTEQAAIAPDHVDRDADEIEHVLPHDLIERLEARLRLEGRLPEAVMPESVHPIAPGDGGRA